MLIPDLTFQWLDLECEHLPTLTMILTEKVKYLHAIFLLNIYYYLHYSSTNKTAPKEELIVLALLGNNMPVYHTLWEIEWIFKGNFNNVYFLLYHLI